MKKIFLLIAMILTTGLFSQNEDLLKMYERITGKDLTKELEKMRSDKDQPGQKKTESEIDTISALTDFMPDELQKDSVEERTYFEKYAAGMLIDPYETELRQFEIDFASVRTNLNYNKQIPDNYVVSPGDIFVIDIWGAMDKSHTIEITNENFIIVPQIGKIDLSGMNYKSAKKTIENKLEKINGIKFSVRLGEVKPVSVFIVGEVTKPGVYNVSPFSSLIEILAVAGGVSAQGSLRNIELISERSGREKVDLYSLLFFGDNQASILESNMTVFIPMIGKQVAIAGNVKREGIFEAVRTEKLSDILEIAGLTPFSDTSRMEIERLDKEGRTSILSVSLKDNPNIYDGDIVRIFSTLVFNSRYVYLKGNFRHNKKIQYNDGMKLGDVFTGNEIIYENTDMNYANIIRKNGMGNRDMMINFSPMSVFEERGDNNIALMARDTIEVFSLDSVSYFPSVEISGEVNRQGIYKFTKDMNVSNLLSYSGGLTANGDLDNIVIIRNSGKEGYDYFSNIEPDKFLLQSDDKVHVFDYAAMNPVQNVQIWGHVKNQGTYVHSKGMSVNDLITLSGGFRNDAMTDSIEVVTGINKNNDILETSWYSLDEADDIKLHPNDIVFIRRIRDYGKVNYVKILGEVQFPGMYALRENEELSDLLERCGGFTNNAQIKSTQIFRDEVRQKQKVKIKELRDELNNKLQLQMIISGNQDLAGALNIAKFDSIEASGRVILDIDQFGNHEEFYFQDKDSIYVPSISRTILVMGEVNQQTAITFNPNKRKVKYYLDKVGGITATADEDNIYVIKSNGELVRKTGWFSSIYSYELEQGDMVYVPYDYSRVDFLELTKDVTTILYQLSLSAATVYQMSR